MKKLLLSSFLFLWMFTSCAPAVPGLVTVTPAWPYPQTATPSFPKPVLPSNGTVSPSTDLPPIPTVQVNPTSPAPIPTPQPSDLHPGYVIDALMDYDAKTIDINQSIDFVNTTGAALSEIVLAVEPNRIDGIFFLQSISLDGTPLSEYSLARQKLTLKLPAPLEHGKTAKLALTYRLSLPVIAQGDPNVIRPQIFGSTERQVNLTDWYPMLVPYDAQNGWVLHDPWFYGEHLVYPLADFDVTLRFTDPLTAPVIAASGASEDSAHYILKNARTFAFAMGRQMKSVSADVNGVTVTSYFYSPVETGGQAVLDATVKAVQTYTELFGPYPHKTLAAVQGDFNDGMEFDGLYYLSNAFYNLYDNTEKNYLVMVAVHETSHQWWFGQVASDQAKSPWLDESLATYCEKLFYEKNYPASVAWWWSYRVDFYQPEGKIDGDVTGYAGFTPYTNATYRQGARFLAELRQRIGDEAFFAFIKDYFAQMSGKTATPADFFRILRTHTSVDFADVVAKYFNNPQ